MNVKSIAAMNVSKMKKEELTSHNYCCRLHGIFNVYLFVQCNLLIVAGEMLQSRGSLRDLCNYFLDGDGKTEFQLKKYPWNYKIYGKVAYGKRRLHLGCEIERNFCIGKWDRSISISTIENSPPPISIPVSVATSFMHWVFRLFRRYNTIYTLQKRFALIIFTI